MLLLAESVCILVGMLSLIVGYLQFNLLPVAIGCFAIGLLWLFTLGRYRAWVASFGIFFNVCASGIGIWLGVSPFLMAFSVLGSLSAWDLTGFSYRLQFASPEDNLRTLEQRHLLLLAIFSGISMVLVLLGLLIRVEIPFGWMFLLVLMTIFGIMKLINSFRREG